MIRVLLKFVCALVCNYISFSLVIRYIGEDSDGDYYRDSSSDGSSDSEFKKRTENSTSQRSNQHRTGDDASLQDLLFEYFDQDPPYSREPLSDKASTDLT